MERRRSKKLGDLTPVNTMASSRPTSGITVGRGRKTNALNDSTENNNDLPKPVSVDVPLTGHRGNSGGNKVCSPPVVPSGESEPPHPGDLRAMVKSSSIAVCIRKQIVLPHTNYLKVPLYI